MRYPTPAERAETEASLAKAASERADIEARRAKTESERAKSESKRADIATAAQIATEQKNNVLRQRLRELGIDPDLIK